MLASSTAEPVTTANEFEISRFLDRVVGLTGGGNCEAEPSRPQASAFVNANTPAEALEVIFGPKPWPSRHQAISILNHLLGTLDELIGRQLNAVLHHKSFQQLEAAWRSLAYLTNCVEPFAEGPAVRIRLWNCGKAELRKDLVDAIEFDQSCMFRAVYSEEFDMPGGQPFGLLIGNYEFGVSPRDIELLNGISIVAAAAFAPFVAAAGPEILGGEGQFPSFDRDRLDQLDRARTGAAWIKWNALRDKDEARFLGLVVPRVLMRVPYRDTALRTDGFRFNEEVAGPDNSRWLWGNGAFSLGEVAIRSFHESGWLASIRGAQVGKRTGGLVTRLPACWIETDRHGVAPRSPTDVLITEQQERGVTRLGLVPLCASRDTPFPVFYIVPSLQKPKQLDQQTANTNALMSSMFQYVLCASQFARQLKVIVRDKIGNVKEPAEVERQLNEWLSKFVTTVADASVETRARYPLREGLVRVVPHATRPGLYHCSIYLMPHFELDDLTAAIRLTTELEPKV